MATILLLICVIYLLYHTSKTKKEKGYQKDTNKEMNQHILPDINAIGMIELEALYRTKKLDAYLKAKYFNRLVKWESAEDPTLHWNGTHTIYVYTKNGGYEKITVKIKESGNTQFDIIKNYNHPADTQKPVVKEIFDEEEINNLNETNKEEKEKDTSSIKKETKETQKEEESAAPIQTKEEEEVVIQNTEGEPVKENVSPKLNEFNIIGYVKNNIKDNKLFISYNLFETDFDQEAVFDELSLCGLFSDVSLQEKGLLVTC